MRFSLPNLSSSRAAVGVLALFLLVCSAGRVQAQQAQRRAPSPDAMADRMVTAMADQLSLSERQQSQVHSIFVSTLKDQRALMKKAQNGDADRKNMRRKMKKMQAQTDEQLAGVLSDEQMEQYRALQKKKKQQRKKQMKKKMQQQKKKVQAQRQQQKPQSADPVEAAMSQLNAQLDLTGDQQAQLRTIFSDQAEKAKKLQQKATGADAQQRSKLMKQARAMQKQTRKRVSEVLTDEQVQTLRKRSMKQRKQQQSSQGGGGNQ